MGITRAMEDLTLTSARTRMVRGEVQYNPVSRFLAEIPDDLLDEESGSRKPKSYSFGDSYDDDFDDFDNRFNDDYSDPDLIPFSFGKTTGTGSKTGFGKTTGTGSKAGFEKSSAARSSTTFGGRSVSGTNPGFGRDISELLNRRGTAAGSTTGRAKVPLQVQPKDQLQVPPQVHPKEQPLLTPWDINA